MRNNQPAAIRAPRVLSIALLAGVVLALAAGGVLLFAHADSSAVCGTGRPCMVYCYASWCKACEQMAPVVDTLESEFAGDLRVLRVNTDSTQGKKLAREMGCIGQPTFVFFDASGTEVRRLIGPQASETLAREIRQIVHQ